MEGTPYNLLITTCYCMICRRSDKGGNSIESINYNMLL
jgi:hypothetical protein